MDVESVALYVMSANYYLINLMYHYRRKITKGQRVKRKCPLQMHRKRTQETMEEIFCDLLAQPSNQFQGFVRMSATDFELLLSRVEPLIKKQNTFRESIPSKIRLAVTLRYLATGDSYRSIEYMFRMSRQVISDIVRECCVALISVLENMIKLPDNEKEWLQKESEFVNIFPHCLGAIVGKNVIVASSHNRYENSNQKPASNIVLVALVDRNFCFMYCDISKRGIISNGNIFRDCKLFEKFQTNSLHLPQPKPLPGDTADVPYVFVADNVCPLHPNIMTPFPNKHAKGKMQRNFNKKLSSVFIIVENALGVMSARFRVLKKPLALHPKEATRVVMACALLHNFLRKSVDSRSIYTPTGYTDTIDNGEIVRPGTWRQDMRGSEGALESIISDAGKPDLEIKLAAIHVQNKLAEYFTGT